MNEIIRFMQKRGEQMDGCRDGRTYGRRLIISRPRPFGRKWEIIICTHLCIYLPNLLMSSWFINNFQPKPLLVLSEILYLSIVIISDTLRSTKIHGISLVLQYRRNGYCWILWPFLHVLPLQSSLLLFLCI